MDNYTREDLEDDVRCAAYRLREYMRAAAIILKCSPRSKRVIVIGTPAEIRALLDAKDNAQ